MMIRAFTAAGGGGGGGGAYGLSNAIAGVPFGINTPTLPTTTSGPTVVTPATIAANLVNGRHVVLSAGTYTNLSVSTTDQLFTLQAGAIVDGFNEIQATAARVMFAGENARDGELRRIFGHDGATDIYFYRTNHQGPASDDEIFFGPGCARIAFVGAALNMTRYNGYFDRVNDLIIANCNSTAYTGSATPRLRLMSCNRTVIVDSRGLQVGQKNLRIHSTDGDSDNHYIARNQFEEGAIEFHGDAGSGGQERLITVTCVNNLLYDSAGLTYVELGDVTDQPEIFTFTGNAAYGYSVMPSQQLPAWTVTPNTSSAYQAPAVWAHAA